MLSAKSMTVPLSQRCILRAEHVQTGEHERIATNDDDGARRTLAYPVRTQIHCCCYSIVTFEQNATCRYAVAVQLLINTP